MLTTSTFSPAPGLRNRHLQTLLPAFPFLRSALPDMVRETVELPDGDFLHLDCADTKGPVIVILHGLEGSLLSRYARAALHGLAAAGWQPVMMNLRGCSGIENRIRRRYHAGETEDLMAVLDYLRRTRPGQPIAALGYSLGGNILLKYLGETGRDAGLSGAMAVSVPFDLSNSCTTVSNGSSRIYGKVLLKRMKAALRRKCPEMTLESVEYAAMQSKTFRVFDDLITAPWHGFDSADEYYSQSSCRQYLAGISVPTLIVQAEDDPFLSGPSLPAPEELADAVILEVCAQGGHVGFISGWPWRPEFWLDERIVQYFSDFFVREDKPEPTELQPAPA